MFHSVFSVEILISRLSNITFNLSRAIATLCQKETLFVISGDTDFMLFPIRGVIFVQDWLSNTFFPSKPGRPPKPIFIYEYINLPSSLDKLSFSMGHFLFASTLHGNDFTPHITQHNFYHTMKMVKSDINHPIMDSKLFPPVTIQQLSQSADLHKEYNRISEQYHMSHDLPKPKFSDFIDFTQYYSLGLSYPVDQPHHFYSMSDNCQFVMTYPGGLEAGVKRMKELLEPVYESVFFQQLLRLIFSMIRDPFGKDSSMCVLL